MNIVLLTAAALLIPVSASFANDNWNDTLNKARGQTVYWNAWGGDTRTNAFISWAGEQVKKRYDVSIQQVKLTDTAEAVTRVIAEKEAGKTSGGAVDLIWINGPNFLSMKKNGLLHGPFVSELPNAQYVDLGADTAASIDFTVPVGGYESPWRLAKFVFNYDSARIKTPPKTMESLLQWTNANPGRFTHPNVSDFMGATFIKQALIELAPVPSVLQSPATDSSFKTATKRLWDWYDSLRPNLWQSGKTFPANAFVQQQLLNDSEIDISMSFDPASAAAAIAEGLLPETIRTYVLDGGTIGNISFVAIPFNATNKEGAEVVANFLLEPETQAHAQNISVLGSFSVLDQSTLNKQQRALFASLPTSPALPNNEALGKTLLEPHASWMTRLSKEWAIRYTQ